MFISTNNATAQSRENERPLRAEEIPYGQDSIIWEEPTAGQTLTLGDTLVVRYRASKALPMTFTGFISISSGFTTPLLVFRHDDARFGPGKQPTYSSFYKFEGQRIAAN